MMKQAPIEPAPGTTTLPPATLWYLENLFTYHVLFVRQQLLTIAQKYSVVDEQGRDRFFVVRPPKLFLSSMATFAQLIVSFIVFVYAVKIFIATQDIVLPFALMIGVRLLSWLIRVLLTPYRDIRIFTDASEQFQTLMITQDNKFGMHSWFTIFDAAGNPVARARRHFVKSMWRRQWIAETMDGREICRVREDSLSLALLRRYLGTMWGLLRTNFDIVFPTGGHAGEYNRKLTITDQYVLDLRDDPSLLIDRRVALSLAILLDTAEYR
ncbi:hypothetical protein IT571_04405 [Candidatus Sumerlaeota bacterium]|nr:hypothetical protein [Candidatus Sumerlaeota bacterium]